MLYADENVHWKKQTNKQTAIVQKRGERIAGGVGKWIWQMYEAQHTVENLTLGVTWLPSSSQISARTMSVGTDDARRQGGAASLCMFSSNDFKFFIERESKVIS